MSHPLAIMELTTAGGYLLVLALMLPVAGVLLAFVLGGRWVERIALAIMPVGLALAFTVAMAVRDAPLVYLLGGWSPPLGVALRADGLAAVMMVVAALVLCAVGAFAHADFQVPSGAAEARAPFAFWILLLAIWAALNMIVLGGDLFTLYVALELLTFAAVPLVCLDGRAETLQAALRYLLFALAGSVLYLVGTALLYGAYGTLDIVLLSQRVKAAPPTLVAATLMTVGLLAKTALVPLHLWLPPAHAGAPAAASAVLSALVVKGSFFLLLRLWFDVMPAVPGPAAAQVLGLLGAAAIILASGVALRQRRLKLLIAYSTLAQIGFLFLLFPLACDPASGVLQDGDALSGGVLQALTHATAKAAMFMAAGTIYVTLGHDRIAALAGAARLAPLSVLTIALAGLALVGLPPGGAYLAKTSLLAAAAETGQEWLALVVQAGGFFTSAYLVLVLLHALASPKEPVVPKKVVSRLGEIAPLVLAFVALLLGLAPWQHFLAAAPVDVGRLLSLSAFASVIGPLLGGAILAVLLARRPPPVALLQTVVATAAPARRLVIGLIGRPLEWIDSGLRQWPVAMSALLIVTVVLGTAMLAIR